MFYTTDANDHGFPHDPFKAIVTPRPIGWIGSIDRDGIANLEEVEQRQPAVQSQQPFGYSSGIL